MACQYMHFPEGCDMEKKPKSPIDLFRLLSLEMLPRRVEIEKQDFSQFVE